MTLQGLRLHSLAMHLCQGLAVGWQCKMHPAWWCNTCISLGHMCQATVQVTAAVLSAGMGLVGESRAQPLKLSKLNCIEITLTPLRLHLILRFST